MASRTALKTREKGAGTVYRDGKRWYLKVRIAGKAKTSLLRNDDGTPCTNQKDAIAAADGYRKILLATDKAEIAVQIAEAKKLKRQSGLKLSEAWDAYLEQLDRPDSAPSTLAKYESYFRLFCEWTAKEHPEIVHVASVDNDLAREYLAALWRSGVSGRTYNAYVQALRMIFKYLMGAAALEANPFDGFLRKPLETASRNEFTAGQVEAIFKGFDTGFFYTTEVEQLGAGRARNRTRKTLRFEPMNADEMRVLLNLCCWTGCRGQDGCLMEWKNINWETEQISYVPRKTARKTGRKAVTLPIHPNLLSALHDALAWRDSNAPDNDYILPHVAVRYQKNPTGIQRDVMKIIRCATGLQTHATGKAQGRRKLAANTYSLHSFRHTFVSFCANAGVPYAVVASIVGHGNPAMTEHYSHISTAAKQSAIDTLPILSHTKVKAQNQSMLKEMIVQKLESASPEQLKQVLDLLNPAIEI